MFLKLLLLFILMPIIEIAILIELGRIIGTFKTISIVIITGIIGAALAKQQGISVVHNIKKELDFGNMPAEQLFDGIFVLIGGILLITPGIITDLIGLMCLIPLTRNILKKLVMIWLKRKIASGAMNVYYVRNI